MNIFNLIFKHKTMSEDNEPQTEETKADEVFRDKPENEEDKSEELPENADESKATEDTELSPVKDETVEEKSEEEVETETDPDPEPVDAEPLYQKKVYIVDLNNLGLKIEGEGSLVVDVMSIDKETQKATVKNGDLTMEVPKEFLF